MWLPGFDGLRVPARFWMMALACLSVVAALAVNRLEGRTRRIVVTIAAAGLLLDGWPRDFTVLPAPPARPAPAGVATRLDLPSRRHQSGRAVPANARPGPAAQRLQRLLRPALLRLRTLLGGHDPRVLHVLAAAGPLGIVIHHDGRSRTARFGGSCWRTPAWRWCGPRTTGAATGSRPTRPRLTFRIERARRSRSGRSARFRARLTRGARSTATCGRDGAAACSSNPRKRPSSSTARRMWARWSSTSAGSSRISDAPPD